jgi:hypothetical protein
MKYNEFNSKYYQLMKECGTGEEHYKDPEFMPCIKSLFIDEDEDHQQIRTIFLEWSSFEWKHANEIPELN